MANKAFSTSTVINVEDEVFAVERFLIFVLVLPMGRFWSGLGFVISNILAAMKYADSPPSKTSTGFNFMFWVERVACILLWYSCVGGVGFCWNASVFLFNLTNMVFLVSNRHAIEQRLRQIKNYKPKPKPIPIVSKSKLKIIKMTEEANETKTEPHFQIESISMASSKGVDANNGDTDTNFCLKLEFEGLEEDGKQEFHILKVGVNDSKEKIDSCVEVRIRDSYLEKKLEELNYEWERKLEEERQLRANMLNKQINYLDKCLSDIDKLIEQAQDSESTWEMERQSIERSLDFAVALSEKLQEEDEERRAWEEERSLLVDKIAAYEIDRENDILNSSLEKIEKLEGEKLVLLHQIAKTAQDSLDSKRVLEESRANFRSLMKKIINGRFQNAAVHNEKISQLEAEKNEIAQKLQELEAAAEQQKTQFQESDRKCQILEEENEHLIENFEMVVQSNDCNQIMQAFKERCWELEEENRILDANFRAVTETSEFYKNILRRSY